MASSALFALKWLTYREWQILQQPCLPVMVFKPQNIPACRLCSRSVHALCRLHACSVHAFKVILAHSLIVPLSTIIRIIIMTICRSEGADQSSKCLPPPPSLPAECHFISVTLHYLSILVRGRGYLLCDIQCVRVRGRLSEFWGE